MDRCKIPAADLSMKNNMDEREQHVRPVNGNIDKKMNKGAGNEAAKQGSTTV